MTSVGLQGYLMSSAGFCLHQAGRGRTWHDPVKFHTTWLKSMTSPMWLVGQR